ncbi:MAG TPA: type I phosphomannose isomerase catalytic subunit [Terriglobales bacterium]|nr:type I phosphomannose isomerase catalytic subunit [Terriglobales bacterium]
MSDLYPLLLLPEFKQRVWGARDLSPIYPNYKVEGEPVGEVWLTGDACRVANGPLAGQTLGDLAKRYGRELVGEAAPEPDRLPLLLKFLFPRQKLSVQVHPTDEDARRAGLPCGKSECWYVVSAEIDAQVGLGLKPGTSRADFEAAVRGGGRADLLLNWIYIRTGEMLYNPAGTVHAIGPGSVLLETQQNSDTTYRLYDYGRAREMHLEQGLAALREQTAAGKVRPGVPDPERVPDLRPLLQSKRSARVTQLIAAPLFVVSQWKLDEDDLVTMRSEGLSPHVLVALDGCGTVDMGGGQRVTLARGDAVIVPAAVAECRLSPQWRLELLSVMLGLPEIPEPEIALP